MLNRISRLISTKKISASQFADEIGVQRSSVSHVLSGRNNPSLDFITKIIQAYPEVNSDWLLTGIGNMLRDESNEDDSANIHVNTQTSIDMLPGMDALSEDKLEPVVPEKKKTGRKLISTGPKVIERIVLFYNDGTFIDFMPNK